MGRARTQSGRCLCSGWRRRTWDECFLCTGPSQCSVARKQRATCVPPRQYAGQPNQCVRDPLTQCVDEHVLDFEVAQHNAGAAALVQPVNKLRAQDRDMGRKNRHVGAGVRCGRHTRPAQY